MNDQVLDIFKLGFIGLLYLFFARVLWSVWSEVRADQRPAEHAPATPAPAPPAAVVPGATPDSTKPLSRRDQRKQERHERKAARRTPTRRGVPSRLVVLEPRQRRGTKVALTGIVTVGRESDNTLLLTDDAFVSTHHARIARTDTGVVLHDLGSRNGTVVNGSRVVGQRELHTGDRIQIGYTLMEAQ